MDQRPKPAGRAKLAYGLNACGRPVHISSVESGLACCCRCAGCGAVLRAHKGQIEHHFHHDTGIDCRTGRETALHLFAKEVLAESLGFDLPEYRVSEHKRTEIICRKRLYNFDSAVLEQSIGEIRPDIVVYRGGQKLLVEIAVTHRCDHKKIKRIRGGKMPAIEIDLSKLPYDADIETVRDAVLLSARRKWLYSPELEAEAAIISARWREEAQRARDALAAKQIKADRQYRIEKEHRLSAVRAKAQQIADNLMTGEMPRPEKQYLFENAIAHVSHNGLRRYAGISFDGDLGFCVRPVEWQSLILSQYVLVSYRKGGLQFPSSWAIETVFDAQCIAPSCRNYLGDEIEAAINEYGCDFIQPSKIILEYLVYLGDAGLLRRTRNDRWYPQFNFAQAQAS